MRRAGSYDGPHSALPAGARRCGVGSTRCTAGGVLLAALLATGLLTVAGLQPGRSLHRHGGPDVAGGSRLHAHLHAGAHRHAVARPTSLPHPHSAATAEHHHGATDAHRHGATDEHHGVHRASEQHRHALAVPAPEDRPEEAPGDDDENRAPDDGSFTDFPSASPLGTPTAIPRVLVPQPVIFESVAPSRAPSLSAVFSPSSPRAPPV